MQTGFTDWFEKFGLSTALLIWTILTISYGVVRVAKWVAPRFDEWLEEHSKTEQSTRKTQDKLSEAFKQTSQTQADQTPILDRVDYNVQHISDTQDDPNSMISNVHTNEKLNMLMRNSRILAHSSIEHMRALMEIHPECKDRFEAAIEMLREIEREG